MKLSAKGIAGVLFRRRRESNVERLSGPQLLRCLSIPDLILVGVGNIVGSGIFILLGTATHIAGPAVTFCFVLAGVSSLCGALCYAEFASRFPVSGTAYAFTYLEAGELLAWNVGWALFFEFIVGFSAVSIGWSNYTRSFVKGLGVRVPWFVDEIQVGSCFQIDPLAIGLIASLSGIVASGIKESKWLNHVATAAKLGALIIVVAIGMFRADPAHWDNFTPNGVYSLLEGSGTVMFAYIGFDVVCSAAEEAKDPTWGLPTGLVGSVLVSMLVYVLVSSTVTLMVPWRQVDMKAPVAEVFSAWLPRMVPLISAAAIVGLLAIGIGAILAASRLLMTLARDGLLPRGIGQVNAGTQTPVVATILSGAAAISFTLSFTYHSLTQMVSVGTMAALSMVCADLVLARRLDPMDSSVWKVPLLLVVFSAGCFALVSSASTPGSFLFWSSIPIVGISSVMILMMRETFRPEKTFCVPCGPAIALIGLGMNILMIVSLKVALGWTTLWALVGNVIYLVYGCRYSLLAVADAESETTPLIA